MRINKTRINKLKGSQEAIVMLFDLTKEREAIVNSIGHVSAKVHPRYKELGLLRKDIEAKLTIFNKNKAEKRERSNEIIEFWRKLAEANMSAEDYRYSEQVDLLLLKQSFKTKKHDNK